MHEGSQNCCFFFSLNPFMVWLPFIVNSFISPSGGNETKLTLCQMAQLFMDTTKTVQKVRLVKPIIQDSRLSIRRYWWGSSLLWFHYWSVLEVSAPVIIDLTASTSPLRNFMPNSQCQPFQWNVWMFRTRNRYLGVRLL